LTSVRATPAALEHDRVQKEDPIMSRHLGAGQRALLQTELEMRQRRLDQTLGTHQEGASRVEHAHDLLAQDEEGARRHAMDREVDMAMSDLDIAELGAVSRALVRLREGDYGLCTDCGAEIPFDRLRVEPQAERCVPCASRHEQHSHTPRTNSERPQGRAAPSPPPAGVKKTWGGPASS
jgi:DnaK suppressor protein